MNLWLEPQEQLRPFLKMQGLGNHFVLFDGRENPFEPSTEEIIRICYAGTGIGAEQLLILEKPTAKGIQKSASVRLRILNPDGKEVRACGNATRCAALLFSDETSRNTFYIETLAGVLRCERNDERISVTMPKIISDWAAIPLTENCDTLHVNITNGPLKDAVALSLGNPYLIYFVENIDTIDVAAVAAPVQVNPLLPESANIVVAQIVDQTLFKMQVFERPGMLTTACGSGACVAVAAARLRQLTSKETVTVSMPGGEIEVYCDDNYHPVMTAGAEYCFSGYWPI